MGLDLQAKKAILIKLSEIGEVAFESRRAEMIPPIPEIESLETKLRFDGFRFYLRDSMTCWSLLR